MAVIKTIFKGESLSLLFTFPVAYDMARIEKHEVYIGETAFTGTVSGQTIALKLKSEDTGAMSGQYKVSLWIDDTTLGVRKPYIGDIVFSNTNATPHNTSTSEVTDIIIPIVISETAVTVGDILYNYVKGDKGDPFLYADFTPAQIAELQQPAADAIASIVAVELAVEQAEALRVQAEIDRQTNTGTAIQNANTATGLANDAAALANSKAILAKDAATNANTKAGLADTAATNANTKAGLANTAATNADNARLAIQTDLGLKLDKSAVKQGLGTSTTDVMSQNSVTDELAKKHQVVVNYTHTGNKEVNIESIDFATGTITATGHGLSVNYTVYPINKGIGNFPFSALPNGINPLTAYFVINVTPNTFQLSATYLGATPITISDKATKDYSKWHFEITGNVTISGLSLRKFTVEIEGKSSGTLGSADYFYLYGGKDYGGASPVWVVDTEYSKIASGLNRAIFKSTANGDVWSYNKLEIDVTGKRASILINGYRIYSLTETTSGIIRHNNEVAVHSSVGEDVVTRFYQSGIFNGMNIKVTKIL